MKVCDKCKGKSKDAKDNGADLEVKMSDKDSFDLCQSCYGKVYKFITGKEWIAMVGHGGEYE